MEFWIKWMRYTSVNYKWLRNLNQKNTNCFAFSFVTKSSGYSRFQYSRNWYIFVWFEKLLFSLQYTFGYTGSITQQILISGIKSMAFGFVFLRQKIEKYEKLIWKTIFGFIFCLDFLRQNSDNKLIKWSLIRLPIDILRRFAQS